MTLQIGPMRILIVEDERKMAELLAMQEEQGELVARTIVYGPVALAGPSP